MAISALLWHLNINWATAPKPLSVKWPITVKVNIEYENMTVTDDLTTRYNFAPHTYMSSQISVLRLQSSTCAAAASREARTHLTEDGGLRYYRQAGLPPTGSCKELRERDAATARTSGWSSVSA